MKYYVQYNLAGFIKKLGPFSKEEAEVRSAAIQTFEGITEVSLVKKRETKRLEVPV